MKITIKTPKPRNPLAIAARQRNAGAHGAHLAQRKQRRTEKQALRSLVTGKKREGEGDA
jgi:hypothetical protein